MGTPGERTGFRSSRSQILLKIRVLKKLCKFHRKAPVLESLFHKVTGLKTGNSIKKKLQHKCFPVKFAKVFRTPFFTEQLQWILEV